jgi:hypothetical protein
LNDILLGDCAGDQTPTADPALALIDKARRLDRF